MDKILPLYCLVGEDDYRRRDYLARIKALLPGGVDNSLNYEYLPFEEADVARVLDSARTPAWDLFGAPGASGKPYRLVVIDGAEAFTADQWKEMRDYLVSPAPGSCLVFLINRQLNSWPGKKFVPNKYIVNFSPLKGIKLRNWIEKEAVWRGLRLTARQVEECALLGEEGLGPVISGLERLAIYQGGEGMVGDREFRDLMGAGRSGSVFNLTELAVAGRVGEALSLLNRLLDEGEAPLRIFALLTGAIRKLWLGREVWERTGDPRAAAEAAGVRYYREQFIRQIKEVSTTRVPFWYRRLVETDQALKGGERDSRLALERLLIDLGGAGSQFRKKNPGDHPEPRR